VVLELPPLRDRPEDIPVLAQAFLNRSAAKTNNNSLALGQTALRALQQHSWPGNVRELENRIKRGVIMAEGRHVTAADLELGDTARQCRTKTLKEAREEAEREVILAALQRHKWKIAPAAADLKISRPTFYELMEKLNIQRPTDQQEGL
jgi:two-component system NtrC family response regulator